MNSNLYWDEYVERMWFVVCGIEYPCTTTGGLWLEENAEYCEVKYYNNFKKFVNGCGLYNIESSNICLESFTLSLSNACLNRGDDYFKLDRFLCLLVSFYIFNDNCNQWSLLMNNGMTKFIPVDSSISVSSRRLKSNIERILDFFKIDVKLEFFVGKLPYSDEMFVWFIFRYSLVINYGHRLSPYFSIFHCSRSRSFTIGVNKNFISKNGWFVVIDVKLYKSVLCSYINNDVLKTPRVVEFWGDDVVGDVISNNKYSSSVWIENPRITRGSSNQFSSGFLSIGCTAAKYIIKSLNFLNSTKYFIDFSKYQKMLVSLNIGNNLTQYLSSPSSTHLDIFNTNKNALFSVLKSEISNMNLLKFHFFLSHVIDNRGRIYVNNIPINYQLERFIRSLIDIDYSSPEYTYSCFFNNYDIEKNWKKFPIFYIQQVDESLVDDIGSKLGLRLSTFKNFTDVAENLTDFIFTDVLFTVLDRLGSKSTIDESLKVGCDVFLKIKEFDLCDSLKILKPSSKKIPETLRLIQEIKDWNISKKHIPVMTWYNDASANVIQLIIYKLFITNEKTLEISNIYSNQSGYRDIYDFVAHSIKATNKPWREFISRDLVKRKIMPGTYGQTHYRFLKEINDLLKNNDDWVKISKKKQNIFALEISEQIWKTLKDSGLDLKTFLTLCKNLAIEFPDKCRWIGKNELPIIIEKNKVKRVAYRASIKNILKNEKNIELAKKKMKMLNEKINKTDKNYARKTIKINDPKIAIKLRYLKRNDEIDINSLSSGISASSNHSDDAYILMQTILELEKLNIKHAVIHDSIGSRIEYSSLIKYIFKLKNLEFNKKIIDRDEFPFDILKYRFKDKNIDKIRENFLKEREISREKFKKNFENFSKKLLNSKNFFN